MLSILEAESRGHLLVHRSKTDANGYRFCGLLAFRTGSPWANYKHQAKRVSSHVRCQRSSAGVQFARVHGSMNKTIEILFWAILFVVMLLSFRRAQKEAIPPLRARSLPLNQLNPHRHRT